MMNGRTKLLLAVVGLALVVWTVLQSMGQGELASLMILPAVAAGIIAQVDRLRCIPTGF